MTTAARLENSCAEALAELDPSVFKTQFNRQAFRIGHHLADHPLFDLGRLVELAQTLPTDRVEYNAGNLPVGQDPNKTPQNGLSPEETIERIASCDSWLALKNVEADPEFKALLDDCLDAVEPYTCDDYPCMHQREAFIFVTSPGSVTPFHIDHEHNFLLQVRGSKEIHIWDRAERRVLTEEDLERYHCGGHRNLVYRDEFARYEQVFGLEPGDGLHFPVTAPHWVQNGPEVSVSFSITFRSAHHDREPALYRLNSKLRRLGLRPTPVGQSVLRDNVKFGAVRAGRAAKGLLKPGRSD